MTARYVRQWWMRIETVRKFALALPETTEEPHFDAASFRVRGKIFCTVPDNTRLHVYVDPMEAAALVAESPDAYEHVLWGKRLQPEWLRVYLRHAQRVDVEGLLEDAWRAKAPKRVVAAYDAACGT